MEDKNKGTAWHDWIKECFPVVFDHIIIVYLPNKDCVGKEFDIRPWETRMLGVMGAFFRGATSYPSRGSYRKINPVGNMETGVVIEKTRMIVSFVSEDDFNEQNIKTVTSTLREFGIETNQESVAFVIDGEMYYIHLEGARK